MANSNMADKGQSGHRKRLRERFLAGETDARSDEMLLELLLTFAIARKDVRPLAQELIKFFGSLSQVFFASPDDLNKIKGLGQSSVTLLKVVNFIQSGTETPEKDPPAKRAGATRQKLVEDQTDKPTPKHQVKDSHIVINDNRKEPEIPSTQSEQNNEISNSDGLAVAEMTSRCQSSPFQKTPSLKRIDRRKFQVSRSHLLEFNHFSRVLSILYDNRKAKRISRQLLIENSGLPDGQVASLVSIGASMGLIQRDDQTLTPVGLIIAEHDIFFEDHGTLEWCHYAGAGSYRNLIWFEVFNHLLVEETATTQEGWQKYFRGKLGGQYTDKTIKDHVPKEVHFIIDAYMKRNFSKLGILHQLPDERLYRRRYNGFAPLVLAAMIYDFCATNEAHLFQVAEMATTPGSPAVVFGLDEVSFRQQIEGIHDRGWLRYETTHNLDQIRLKPGLCALEFLTAHYKNEEL